MNDQSFPRLLADVGGKNLDALGTAMADSRCRFAP